MDQKRPKFSDRLAHTYGDSEWTCRQANERIHRLADALRGLEVQKGTTVAFLLHSSPEFIAALFACFKAGMGSVPINFRLHP